MTTSQDIERCRSAISALRLACSRGQPRTQADLDAQLQLYVRSLAPFGSAVVAEACREWAETQSVWPSLSELRTLCVEAQKRREHTALQPPADLDRALQEFVRYAPPQRWRELRGRDSDGRIRRAAAKAWLAAVPQLDGTGDRHWRAQKADLADRLVEAFELAVDSPERACPGGDLWPHVCRVEPGRWRDETQRRWRSADELRDLVAEPVTGAVGPLAPAIRDMAASVIRRHAEAGVIQQRNADELLALVRTKQRERAACA